MRVRKYDRLDIYNVLIKGRNIVVVQPSPAINILTAIISIYMETHHEFTSFHVLNYYYKFSSVLLHHVVFFGYVIRSSFFYHDFLERSPVNLILNNFYFLSIVI